MDVIAVIDMIFWVYMMMLFVRILGSWIPELEGTTFFHFVAHYTDPYLNFFRKIIPPLGMLDFSPIVAFLALGVIEHTVKYIVALALLG
jgi:YggT family protein